MSAVTKCDICGEIYDENRVWYKLFNISVTEQDSRTGDYHRSAIDCCLECTKKIDNLIDILKQNHDYMIWIEDTTKKE